MLLIPFIWDGKDMDNLLYHNDFAVIFVRICSFQLFLGF